MLTPVLPIRVATFEGEPTRSAVTDKDGDWRIDGLNPNKEYEVRFIKPEGWEVTGKVPGSDESGLLSKVTLKPNEYNDTYDLGLKKEPGVPTPPVTVTEQVPVTETVKQPVPTPSVEEGNNFLDRCVANAVRSPFLYLVPVAILGAVGGEIARPYAAAVNEQVNKINGELQDAWRRNTPDWGVHGNGGRNDDQFAELRAQFDAANRQLQQMAADPDVQRFGTIAAGVIGLIAAGAVIYDWCSNEPGEAFTVVKGSSGAGSSDRGDAGKSPAPTTVAPTTTRTTARTRR